MNPRYRRMLIPGLLVALLVIVIVTSIARRADAADGGPTVVSRMGDPRIGESSGLAVSRADPGVVYTINDSGNAPVVYAIRVATGAVVGTTRVEGGSLLDTEAIAIDAKGILWVSDTGDNNHNRDNAALYAFSEPGTGNHVVTARRYPVSYPDGHPDVEALLIDPRTDAKLLVSKEIFGGTYYALPSVLSRSRTNRATNLDVTSPSTVTDGTFTPDGSFVVLRDYTGIFLVDPADWSVLRTSSAPAQQQGESLVVEPGSRSLLVGSEGVDSALIRVPYTLPAAATPAAATPAENTPKRDAPEEMGIAGRVWVYAAGALVVLAGAVVLIARRPTPAEETLRTR